MTDTAGPIFFDTNVALYLISADARKADLAEAALAEGGKLSVQVLNEFVAVARRKFAVPWDRIEAVLDALCTVCEVVPLTLATHRQAVALAQRFGFTIYDATIVAAALAAGCTRLCSEDLQSGQRIEGLRIVNPFADA